MIPHFEHPFGLDIMEGGLPVQSKTYNEDIRLWVSEGTEAVIIILTRDIIEDKTDGGIIHHYISCIVIEDGWDIISRKGVGRIGDKHTRFPTTPIAGNDTFDVLHV